MTGLRDRDGRTERHEVVIVGAGFAGMAAAIALTDAGIEDWIILERADDVGGTWRDNTYPGAACDIPSHVYSLAAAPKADWTEAYSSQPEIFAYQRQVADDFGIYERARFGTAVASEYWDDDRCCWVVTTEAGEVVEADHVINGLGILRDPAVPAIPGLDSFGGPLFHSNQWDHDVDLAGLRVGVIGTGASAIQFVPEIAPDVAALTVFQRTPPWIVPRRNRRFSHLEKRLYERFDLLRAANRTFAYWRKEARILGFGRSVLPILPMQWRAKQHLRAAIDDPALRRVLTPDYRMGCKRVLISNDWYPALARENVDVEVRGIAAVTPHGVRLDDGTEQAFDALVLGTGFQVDRPLGEMVVTGRGGRDLASWWGKRPRAYLGITVPGFPNLWTLLGPNTGTGHQSVVHVIESQVAYVVDAITRSRRSGEVYDVTEEACDDYVADLDRRLERYVWSSGCASWYLNEDGENFTTYPGTTAMYRRRTARFDPTPYEVLPRPAVPAERPVEVGAVG